MSYGLFYLRKRSLSRAAQLFVTQLRQVETALQVREQRAVARTDIQAWGRGKTRKAPATSRRTAPEKARRSPSARKRR
jgi:hypothetical protein